MIGLQTALLRRVMRETPGVDYAFADLLRYEIRKAGRWWAWSVCAPDGVYIDGGETSGYRHDAARECAAAVARYCARIGHRLAVAS